MRRSTGSTLEVSARHLVRNVTVLYACWWQKVARPRALPYIYIGAADRIKMEGTIFWPYVD